MGASAREIEREIRETRERMDQNLNRLEHKASTSAARTARIAAIMLGAAAVGGVAFLIYRRTRKRTLKDRLDDLSIDKLSSLLAEASERLRDRLPSVTVRLNEKTVEEPGTFESILRRVAPALLGTAGSALLHRVTEQRDRGYAAPQAE